MFVTTAGGNTASGNNPGSAGPNSHIALASALGACNALPPAIVVNEVTSAATAYALSAFAPAAGTAPVTFQASSTASATGITNAFALIPKLVDATTGMVSTTGTEAPVSALNLQQQLHTLANAMAACNNSNNVGAVSSMCAELFACASPSTAFNPASHTCAGGSITINDTLNAALAIAQNPGLVSSAGIFEVAGGSTAYSPTLAMAPNDWSLALIYSITNLGPLAIDAAGDVWILTDNGGSPASLTVAEFAPDGHPISPSGGWTTGGISNITASSATNLAIDPSGNVWVGGAGPIVAEINSQGVGVASAAGWNAGSGPSATAGVAIDAGGNAWFADGGAPSAFELGTAGNDLSGSNGYAASVCGCIGIVSDKVGAVWLLSGTGIAQMNAQGVQGSMAQPPSGSSELQAIAPDAAGTFWITDQQNASVWQFTPSGASGTFSASPFSNYSGAGNVPKGIAVDGAGHKWIANQQLSSSTPPSSVTELSSLGTASLSPALGLSSGLITGAHAIAIDQSGNVWVSDGGSSLAELVGAGAPTRNPLAAAVDAGNFNP